jgi:hypothetical protein
MQLQQMENTIKSNSKNQQYTAQMRACLAVRLPAFLSKMQQVVGFGLLPGLQELLPLLLQLKVQ